ncbi:MAG: HNH endonuclease [Caldilineaceae bacterium]|nr:HNH endonuclease [Caldilineaceae bacterium]
MSGMPRSLREQVFLRARACCEYCRTARRLIAMPLVVDHVTPRSAGGDDTPDNLCAACYRCNEFKGARTHARDPLTQALVPLFNPRTQRWGAHFRWENGGIHVVGLTPTGRASVIALRLNNEYVVESRTLWIAQDWHPPHD